MQYATGYRSFIEGNGVHESCAPVPADRADQPEVPQLPRERLGADIGGSARAVRGLDRSSTACQLQIACMPFLLADLHFDDIAVAHLQFNYPPVVMCMGYKKPGFISYKFCSGAPIWPMMHRWKH